MSAAGSDIDPGTLLDWNGTLYLVAPLHAQGRLAPVLEPLIMTVVRAAQDRAAAETPVDPGLLLLLDEAGTTAPLRQLPQLAATGRGQQVQVVSVWQSLGQIEERYGSRLAQAVVKNHHAQLALAGISDLPTLDHFSRLCGDGEVSRTTITAQAAGGRSRSTAPEARRLASVQQLRQLQVGQGLLVYGSLPPALLRLRRWRQGRTVTPAQQADSDSRRELPAARAAAHPGWRQANRLIRTLPTTKIG